MDWQIGDKIRATVRSRKTVGLGVKPAAFALEGRRVNFSFGWIIEDADSRYPGEVAWVTDIEYDTESKLPWIASGDLEDVTRIE